MLILNVMLEELKSSYRGDNTSYTEKNQNHIPWTFVYKVFRVMINLIKQMFFTEEKMRFIDLLKQFLQSMIIGGE